MYDGARVPSPGEGANGLPLQPAAHPQADEEPEEEEAVQQPEPVLVKKAHREILDHERKRRVELKCMELQEMMEEQGYSEEEIRQKVGTFRQMLMEKEGVITREGSHPRPQVTVLPHGDGEDAEGHAFADGYEEGYNWHGNYYDRDSLAHDEYRDKRKSSSSLSPPPKKRKKKKGRRHSRVDSSSPTRRGKRKKSSKKHKRDRSASGSRRKRRHRSGTPKNKHKDKSKLRKKSPVESASRRPQHRGSCCSSRSASASSIASVSKSPSRSNQKHKTDEHKPCGRSSPSLSPSLGQEHATHRQNGHHSSRVRNGKDSGPNHLEGERVNDKLHSVASSSPSEAQKQTSPNVREAKSHGASCRSPGGLPAGEAWKGDERQQRGGKHPSELSGRRGGRQRALEKSGHSPTHSSDSQLDLQPKAKSAHQKKAKGSHSSKKHHRGRGPNRHRSTSASPGRHKHASGRKKSKAHGSLRQRSRSWSSGRSSSRSNSREHAASKTKSPHPRQNNSRERDSPHYSDAERARRRSRSYSPIRKRRRDSPSFMEARRITSARKRPIPYYRPSPSSSSSASSYSSSSRSRSRSYDSYSSYSRSRSRSRSRSKSTRSRSRSRSRSFSRSPSQAHSYYSHSSSESPGF